MRTSQPSLWALVSGHWSAWQAARVEVAQQAEAEKLEAEPIEERVLDRLVRDTDMNLTAPASTSAVSPELTALDIDALLAQIEDLRATLTSHLSRPSQPQN